MIRAQDVIVLTVLAWWLLKDKESMSVSLEQTCVYNDGSFERVPLGMDCPEGSELMTYDGQYSSSAGYEQLGGCGCGGGCK